MHAHFFFCSDSTQLTVFIELVAVIPSLDTFNLSMEPTVIPMIRVPRVRTELATLSSKWVQRVRQYKLAGVHRNNGL